eukprot:CAMPEP_0176096598 /NCGR_PEP_ID=MMETSP0120_2-20121206/48426_1 /TAXON_ID=160619 /ORGANISM="Kryptoperidinium foliaceum, Strain CCMP 1326" /LENGTH=155 /DNA_ID=CAMNT_0017430585 /DNA_START=37 /DNA_END=501 /DNA_ORIENTATION=-
MIEARRPAERVVQRLPQAAGLLPIALPSIPDADELRDCLAEPCVAVEALDCLPVGHHLHEAAYGRQAQGMDVQTSPILAVHGSLVSELGEAVREAVPHRGRPIPAVASKVDGVVLRAPPLGVDGEAEVHETELGCVGVQVGHLDIPRRHVAVVDL